MVRLSSTINQESATAPVVFLTGAARRVGAETARVFHAAGYRVVIHYRSSEPDAIALVEALNQARPDSAACIQSALDTRSSIQAAADDAIAVFGQVDVLINNASSFFPTPWGEITEDAINPLMHSNLLLPMAMIQALAPELKRREGAIINLVDIHALRPLANHPAYSAAKAGLVSLTKSAALDLAPRVRANAIAPGAILLPEHEGADHEQSLIDQVPLNRMGSPTDIAEAALFLATAPYITGQILAVDGGRTLRQ
ncbi:pteridine reductase [Saccharospirillum sp.]|uniref:pteridine reductase n=1 Tax=Saccharospirillum sp. TaxID=2033801 RepID=UPI0034A084BA